MRASTTRKDTAHSTIEPKRLLQRRNIRLNAGMPVQVRGYRGGVGVASALLGPFWDEVNQTGTIEALSGFTGIERLEIRSDVAPDASSDVSFFLEAVSYTATDTYVDPSTPSNDDDDDGGAAFGLMVLAGVLLRRRLHSGRQQTN